MNKTLTVWLEKEAVMLDKDSNLKIDKYNRFYIKTTNLASQTVKIGIERKVSLKQYQQGYIGKYTTDNKAWLQRFLQKYAVTNNLTLVVNPLDFKTNEEDLYGDFREFCEKNNLEPLLKPSGGSAHIVYDQFNSNDIKESLKQSSNVDEYITSAIDWYNAGLLQTKATNLFLHYFIPLEILAGRFITKSGVTWKSENSTEYKAIIDFLKKTLQNKDPNKLSGSIWFLSELSFIEKIKRYFLSIFSSKEIKDFWQSDNDITFNGKWIWKQYRLMSQYKKNESRVDLFNVLKNLHQKRNDIVHKGIEDISSEDVFIIENILRRVLKKEITNFL